MKKTEIKKLIAVITGFALAGAMLTGCGSSSASAANTPAESTAEAEEATEATEAKGAAEGAEAKRTIIVQTSESNDPFAFKNDNGEPDGYEVDVFNAVAELLPQYDFKIETGAKDALLNNLESGKSDIYAFTGGDEGQQASDKLKLGKESYMKLVNTIFILEQDKDKYHSLDDFAGKTVYSFPGELITQKMLDYSEEHPDNPIDVQYVIDGATVVNDLVSGKTDGFVRIATQVPVYSKRFGVDLAAIQFGPLQERDVVYVYRADEDQQLVDDIDNAVKQLKESGKLDEIHGKWFFGTPWDFDTDINEWISEHPEYADWDGHQDDAK